MAWDGRASASSTITWKLRQKRMGLRTTGLAERFKLTGR
jgi:hypothetical protein